MFRSETATLHEAPPVPRLAARPGRLRIASIGEGPSRARSAAWRDHARDGASGASARPWRSTCGGEDATLRHCEIAAVLRASWCRSATCGDITEIDRSMTSPTPTSWPACPAVARRILSVAPVRPSGSWSPDPDSGSHAGRRCPTGEGPSSGTTTRPRALRTSGETRTGSTPGINSRSFRGAPGATTEARRPR